MTTLDLSINQRVADKLREVADLLEQQGANTFRVRAYRNAANTVVALQLDLRDLVKAEGLKGLKALPTIGQGIGAAIYELITTEHVFSPTGLSPSTVGHPRPLRLTRTFLTAAQTGRPGTDEPHNTANATPAGYHTPTV